MREPVLLLLQGEDRSPGPKADPARHAEQAAGKAAWVSACLSAGCSSCVEGKSCAGGGGGGGAGGPHAAVAHRTCEG